MRRMSIVEDIRQKFDLPSSEEERVERELSTWDAEKLRHFAMETYRSLVDATNSVSLLHIDTGAGNLSHRSSWHNSGHTFPHPQSPTTVQTPDLGKQRIVVHQPPRENRPNNSTTPESPETPYLDRSKADVSIPATTQHSFELPLRDHIGVQTETVQTADVEIQTERPVIYSPVSSPKALPSWQSPAAAGSTAAASTNSNPTPKPPNSPAPKILLVGEDQASGASTARSVDGSSRSRSPILVPMLTSHQNGPVPQSGSASVASNNTPIQLHVEKCTPDQEPFEASAVGMEDSLYPKSYMASMRVNRNVVRTEVGFLTVNNYVCFDEIGRGSNSVVFQAQKLDDEGHRVRDVAVKIIPRDRIAGRRRPAGSGAPSKTPVPSPPAVPIGVSGSSGGGRSETPSNINAPIGLQHEIAVMKKVKHEHVMRLLEAIDDENHQYIYLIMPYAENGPLLKKLQAKEPNYIRIPETTAIRYMKQIAKGLLYLHSNNIVHHDIKPDNILMGTDERLYIADFGMSAILEAAPASDTPPTSSKQYYRLMGTPAFHAPEIDLTPKSRDIEPREDARNTRRHSLEDPNALLPPPAATAAPEDRLIDEKKLDMWALGITYYMMITGVLPFTKDPLLTAEQNPPNALDPEDPDFFTKYRERIRTETIEFPDYYISNSIATWGSMSLLAGLLQRDPSKRLNAEELVNHRVLRSLRSKLHSAIEDASKPGFAPSGEGAATGAVPAATAADESCYLLDNSSFNSPLLSPNSTVTATQMEELFVTSEDLESAITTAPPDVKMPRNFSHSQLFSTPAPSPYATSLKSQVPKPSRNLVGGSPIPQTAPHLELESPIAETLALQQESQTPTPTLPTKRASH